MKKRSDYAKTTIVLVEDRPDDVFLFNRIVSELLPRATVQAFVSENEFLDWLEGRSPHPVAGVSLIFLDVNLSKGDSYNCLRTLQQHPTLKSVPTIFLTTSSQSSEVERAYQAGVHSYVIKPLELDAFRLKLMTIFSYWFETVTLP